MNKILEFTDLYYWESTDFMEYVEKQFLESKWYDNIEDNYREYLKWFDFLHRDLQHKFLNDYFNNK